MMGFLDSLALFLLLITLGFGIYLLWINIPLEPVQFEEFKFIEKKLPEYYNGTQFYPNMRYRDRAISYSISDSCDLKRKVNVESAFSLISEDTILKFYRKNTGAEIKFLCSDISPLPDEESHFVAGEGGPSEIINTTNYAVIFSGKVSLFRENECERPNVAIHEIFHALGFDHSNNPKSVMYPVTKCDQIIDQYLLDDINRLYKTDSAQDLAFENVRANKTGRYLNFEASVINIGLQDSLASSLIVYSGEEKIEEFDLKKIEIGTKKILSVQNLRVFRDSDRISFEIKSFEKELDKENNFIELRLVSD